MRLAREAGIELRMLPAVSALDCLFADLGIEPGEGPAELRSDRVPDARQTSRSDRRARPLAALSDRPAGPGETPDDGPAVLADYLLRWYPAPHEVVVYEASPFPPRRRRSIVSRWGSSARIDQACRRRCTPPGEQATLDPEMLARLGLTPESPSGNRLPRDRGRNDVTLRFVERQRLLQGGWRPAGCSAPWISASATNAPARRLMLSVSRRQRDGAGHELAGTLARAAIAGDASSRHPPAHVGDHIDPRGRLLADTGVLPGLIQMTLPSERLAE